MKKLLLTLMLAFSINASFVQEAKAVSVIATGDPLMALEVGGWITWGGHPAGPAILFACVITLPICLLEDEVEANGIVSADLLRDNGYEEDEVKTIMQDQARLTKALEQRGRKLKLRSDQRLTLQIGEKDDEVSIARELKAYVPSISDLYVDFYLGFNGL